MTPSFRVFAASLLVLAVAAAVAGCGATSSSVPAIAQNGGARPQSGPIAHDAAATPTPSPVRFTLSSTSLTFLASAQHANVTITDPTSYAGAYTATSSATAVATASVSGKTVTVTAAGAGGATITVRDTTGRSATIGVAVTTTQLELRTSPNTHALSAAVAVGTASPGPTTIVNVTPSTPPCATSATASVCAMTIAAPPGSDTFVLRSYSGTNRTGSELGASSAAGTVVAEKANTLSLTIAGIAASVALVVTDGSNRIPGGYPTAVPVSVTAKDASGAAIVAPAAYAYPLTLTNSDTTGVTKLSPTSVPAPGTAVTLTYDGGVLRTAARIGAAASALSSANVSPGSFLDMADRFWGFNVPLKLAGTQTRTVTNYGATGSTTTNSAFNYSRTITLLQNQSFNGGTYTDSHVADTIAETSPSTGTTTYVADEYRRPQLTSTGAYDHEYAQVNAEVVNGGSLHVSWTLTETGPQLIDELPHLSPANWTNLWLYALTASVTGNGTSSEHDSVASTGTGSFSETFTGTAAEQPYILDPVDFYSTSWSARSASIGANDAGTQTETSDASGYHYADTFGVPSSSTITYTNKRTSGPTPLPAPTSYAVPNWYPSPKTAVPVSQYAVVSTPAQPFPAGCTVPSSIATKGNEVVATITTFDPFFGKWVVEMNTSYYVPLYGPVCQHSTRTIEFFTVSTGVLHYKSVQTRTLSFQSI